MRQSLSMVAVGLAVGLLTTACASQGAPVGQLPPGAGSGAVVAAPTEPMPTQRPATPAPASVIGKWKALKVLSANMTKVRPVSLEFYAAKKIDSRWLVPTNGGGFDGCNATSVDALFGAESTVRIYPGFTTTALCSDVAPLYDMFTHTHAWSLSTGTARTLLTFYDADDHPIGVFERTKG